MKTAVERFEIVLEHDIDEQYQYEPGEALSGDVLLELSQPVKIAAIQVQIRGESAVSWEEESGRGGPYHAEEVYIDACQNLLGGHSVLLTLDAGVHRYPLRYMLPEHLPSSFIGKHGSITYVVKATLKEDARFGLSTMITSEPFLVLRRLELSGQHNLQMAQERKLVKTFRAFCAGGKVNVDFKVNKTGHLPGEDIFMDAEISNESPRTVEAIEASIVMHSTFRAGGKSRYNRQVVNKKRDEWELTSGEGRRWKGVRLTVPPYIPESRLDGCQLIDITYELLFRVDLSGGRAGALSCVIPLTVGSSGGHQPRSQPPSYSALTGDNNNWRSRGDGGGADNMATLPLRGGDGYGMGGGVDAADVDLFDEATLRFRRPMEHGGTRVNPLLEIAAEEGGEQALSELSKQLATDRPLEGNDLPGNDLPVTSQHVNGHHSNYIEPTAHSDPEEDDAGYADIPRGMAPPPPPSIPSTKSHPAPPPPPLRPDT